VRRASCLSLISSSQYSYSLYCLYRGRRECACSCCPYSTEIRSPSHSQGASLWPCEPVRAVVPVDRYHLVSSLPTIELFQPTSVCFICSRAYGILSLVAFLQLLPTCMVESTYRLVQVLGQRWVQLEHARVDQASGICFPPGTDLGNVCASSPW
jgi:hypothetical protein